MFVAESFLFSSSVRSDICQMSLLTELENSVALPAINISPHWGWVSSQL